MPILKQENWTCERCGQTPPGTIYRFVAEIDGNEETQDFCEPCLKAELEERLPEYKKERAVAM